MTLTATLFRDLWSRTDGITVDVVIDGTVYTGSVDAVDVVDAALVVTVDADTAEILQGYSHRVAVADVESYEVA